MHASRCRKRFARNSPSWQFGVFQDGQGDYGIAVPWAGSRSVFSFAVSWVGDKPDHILPCLLRHVCAHTPMRPVCVHRFLLTANRPNCHLPQLLCTGGMVYKALWNEVPVGIKFMASVGCASYGCLTLVHACLKLFICFMIS